jgi:hypothetical protein
MLKIKIKTENSIRLTIPLPYFALHFAASIICTDFVWNRITKVERNPIGIMSTESYPPINKRLIKPLLKTTIKEIQNYRGTTIVDLKESSGSEIIIKL